MPAIPILLLCGLAGCSGTPDTESVEGPPPPGRGPEPPAAPREPPAPAAMPGRVTFDATRMDLRALVDAIGRETGANVVVDPGIEEEVTLRLVDVDWREAIDAIARETGTRVVEESERRVRLARPPSIRMELHDADVRTVLLAIAAQAGVSIVIPADVQGKVTLSLVDVPWMDALDAVASCSGHVLVRGRSFGR